MKAFTDISQSRKLTEFLPIESADMYYFLDPTPAGNIYHIVIPQIDFGVKTREPEYNKGDIPCWSLAALLGVLPKMGSEEPMLQKFYYANNPTERYICQYSLTDMTSEYSNPVDACVAMIEKLHEQNIL